MLHQEKEELVRLIEIGGEKKKNGSDNKFRGTGRVLKRFPFGRVKGVDKECTTRYHV